MALISRDPFAREEIHRERVYDPPSGCKWCGNYNHTTPRHHVRARKFLYAYRVETDTGRKHVLDSFCCESCRKNYNL